MSKSSCTPVPRALMMACTSWFCRIRSMRAFSTLRIFPRIGRIAWIRGSRPPLADPPAESPSTTKTSHSSGLVDWQSDSLPGSPPGDGRGLTLADDRLALAGILLEPVPQLGVDYLLHERARLCVAELCLGLALELGLGELDR